MASQWFRRRTAIILGLVAVLLAAAAFGLYRLVDRSRTALLRGIHDNCVSTATETARARGTDVARSEVAQKLESYCSCVVESVKSDQVTSAELAAFSADPQSADPAVAKVRQVVAGCLR